MTCKPTQPRTFKPKIRKKSKTHWRSGRVIKKGADMAQLRAQAFDRSMGECENEVHHPDCKRRIFWQQFDLHHIVKRARGGSDVLENVKCLSYPCHRMEHGEKVRAA